ncbi:hypothetical protein V1318_03885 [Lysobacter sp. CCNWLW3]|uniref:hypothetical protein n=1 Tax=unclassified Lysobacter TaxID=2635362 RepID=UPI002FD5B117
MRYIACSFGLSLCISCNPTQPATPDAIRLSAQSCEVYADSMAIRLSSNTGLRIAMFDQLGAAFHIGEPPFSLLYSRTSIKIPKNGHIHISSGSKKIEIEGVDARCAAWLSRNLPQ